MNEKRLESDREYVKNVVNTLIDGFFNDLKKVNNNLQEKEKLITKLEYGKTLLARAYAIKLGVLITKKHWKKLCQKKGDKSV